MSWGPESCDGQGLGSDDERAVGSNARDALEQGHSRIVSAHTLDPAIERLDHRLELIDAIWDTLPDEALPPLSDEWMTEIGRRSAELAAGTANTVTWEVVRSEARARLRTAPIRDQAE